MEYGLGPGLRVGDGAYSLPEHHPVGNPVLGMWGARDCVGCLLTSSHAQAAHISDYENPVWEPRIQNGDALFVPDEVFA